MLSLFITRNMVSVLATTVLVKPAMVAVLPLVMVTAPVLWPVHIRGVAILNKVIRTVSIHGVGEDAVVVGIVVGVVISNLRSENFHNAGIVVRGDSIIDRSNRSTSNLGTISKNEVSKSLAASNNAVVVLPRNLFDHNVVNRGSNHTNQVAIRVNDGIPSGSSVGGTLDVTAIELVSIVVLVSARVVVAAVVPYA